MENKIKKWLSDGSGSGSGSGSGFGSGSGDGSGDGYWDGYWYGCKIGNDFVHNIDSTPTMIKNIKGDVASGYIMMKDLSQIKTYVVKGGGYFAHGETIKLAMQALEDKIILNLEPEELIEKFLEVTDTNKNYTAQYFFDWHGKLTGSCLQGRELFVKNKNIRLESEMNMYEFIEICKNDYGKDVILQLESRIKENEAAG